MPRLILVACLVGMVAPAHAQLSCAGDCDRDGKTSVAEVVRGVRVALGLETVEVCPDVDVNCDALASISELIASVRVALEGCRPVSITVVGDSITLGVDGPPTENGLSIDPEGGFVGRLGDRLAGRAVVGGRGIPGSGPTVWLRRDLRDGTFFSAFVAEYWPEIEPPPPGRESLIETILVSDDADVILIFLGVNELLDVAGVPASRPEEIVSRIEELAEEAEHGASEVVVCTLLDNRRDEAADIARMNAEIRSRLDDVILLGERFAEAGGANLLGDVIHPSMAGHEVLAAILQDEMERRGIVPVERGIGGCGENAARSTTGSGY